MELQTKLRGEELRKMLEVIAKAAALLEERGFCKEKFLSGQSLCLTAALVLAAGGTVTPDDRIGQVSGTKFSDEVEQFVAIELGFNDSLPPNWFTARLHNCGWNNKREQTKETAVAMLRTLAQGQSVIQSTYLQLPVSA